MYIYVIYTYIHTPQWLNVTKAFGKAGDMQMAQQKGTAKSPLPREEAEHLREGRLMIKVQIRDCRG